MLIEISLIARRFFYFPVADCKECAVEEENFGKPFDSRSERLNVRDGNMFVAILLVFFLVSNFDE